MQIQAKQCAEVMLNSCHAYSIDSEILAAARSATAAVLVIGAAKYENRKGISHVLSVFWIIELRWRSVYSLSNMSTLHLAGAAPILPVLDRCAPLSLPRPVFY